LSWQKHLLWLEAFSITNPFAGARLLPTEEMLTMKKNEAGWDRGVRIVLGLGLLSLTVVGPQTWLGLLGLVPLVTGLWGFCPLYRVFGLSTCPVPK
jgi:hypothetical protein